MIALPKRFSDHSAPSSLQYESQDLLWRIRCVHLRALIPAESVAKFELGPQRVQCEAGQSQPGAPQQIPIRYILLVHGAQFLLTDHPEQTEIGPIDEPWILFKGRDRGGSLGGR